MKSLRRVASVLLALLAGIFFLLIWWVALAVSLRMMFQEWRLRHTPARTVDDILMAADLTINWETTAEPISVMTQFQFPPLSVSQVRTVLARAGL